MSDEIVSWEKDQRLVLSELKRCTDTLELLRSDISGLKIEVAMLKVKSGLWGAAAGSVPVIIALLMKQFG